MLAQVGLQQNVLSSEVYNLILTSSLVTIVLTPAAFAIRAAAGEWFAAHAVAAQSLRHGHRRRR